MFRKAAAKDGKAVYELICDMEHTMLPEEGFLQMYEEMLQDRHHVFLICEIEKRVIGVLHLRLEAQLHHVAYIAEIMEFAMDKEFRSKGFGRELFAYAADVAKQAGCVQMEVACNQLRKDTHRFYLREGMHNFHYKFSKSLTDTDFTENALGR